MPVFHTKTIESILEPVAQQVSRLVILHEEAEDGNAMPDLEQPVKVVGNAVLNLVKVGRETINNSDDPILRQDMPSALIRVEKSSKLLEEASGMLKVDPFSSSARKRLIEGSGGILQATSALLLCFDESEVRKIIRECKRVLDYLAVSEVIETMEELVQFLRDLSPCLSKVTKEVSAREKELTHKVHSEILIRCLEEVKNLAPILICSMKIFIHINSVNGKGIEEAAENRNYLAQRISDEINEIIRVLQLTSYDEETSDLDDLTVLRKLNSGIVNKINTAKDWLTDPKAVRGGVGEKSLRQIARAANAIAERFADARVARLAAELGTMTDALCELRQDGAGATPQAEALARGLGDKLGDLGRAVADLAAGVDRDGLRQTAHTVHGRLEQARKWLTNPSADDGGLGRRAIALIVEEGRRVADGLAGVQRAEALQLCDETDSLARDLAALCAEGRGDSAAAAEVARRLSGKLLELKERIGRAVVDRVVEDFIDIATPLRQFAEAVVAPEGAPDREKNFADKAASLRSFAGRAVKTARMVAAGGSGGNKKLAEALQSQANQLDSLTPQLISAGSIRSNYPESRAADEHFENLRRRCADVLARARDLCDEATDSAEFVGASAERMRRHTFLCEEAAAAAGGAGGRERRPQRIVDGASAIARLANRVLLVAKQESDNSEDAKFIEEIGAASEEVQNCLPRMVQDAKLMAMNPEDHSALTRWRESNKILLNAVGNVRSALRPELPPLPDVKQLNISVERAPPRPPPPTNAGDAVPARPPPPETDDEDEPVFRTAPSSSQPIMVAAHNLHKEIRQWSSKDNSLIAAARKMALLMARLSDLVHEDDPSAKRQLIATAKAIADSSSEVTSIAKRLARECTDKRIRTNLLQVCERIPTIATQLKILSTVKATMLGAQGSEEDREATEMLVGNAQNLMESVKETVRAAEGASIKIHQDRSQGRLRWVRRQPWYHY